MAARDIEKSTQEESLLQHDEDDDNTKFVQSLRKKSIRTAPRVITLVVSVVASMILGFFVGQVKHDSNIKFGLPMPPGSVETEWNLNEIFTQRPTPESEAAWNSLVPVGRGFVHHEDLAPFISNIAVFHQMHCLHGILVAYYKALESPPTAPIPQFDAETGVKLAQPHIHHCFDYLRQAIMCAADTNLEVLDEDHKTNGFGQKKTCRSYDTVLVWAEKYANSTDTGITS